jgi:AraC-like DNA-binding protein
MVSSVAIDQVRLPPTDEQLGVVCTLIGQEQTRPQGTEHSQQSITTLRKSRLFSGFQERSENWILTYVVQGAGEVEVEDASRRAVHPGDVILIPPENTYRIAMHRDIDHCLYYVTFEGESLTERKVCTAIDELFPLAHIGLNVDVVNMFQSMIDIGRTHTDEAQREAGATIVLLVAKLVNLLHRTRDKGYQPSCVERARTIMATYIRDHVTVASLARQLGMPVSTFNRVFRAESGKSPYHFFLQHKVEATKAELRDVDIPLRVIAEKYGFTDQYHFSRVFTQVTGMRPSEWRQQDVSALDLL